MKFEMSGDGRLDLQSARVLLLGIDDVEDAFVTRNRVEGTAPWITVTRAKHKKWEMVEPRVRQILDNLPLEETSIDEDRSTEEAPVSGTEFEIREVLDARVRPSVQMDGGDVDLLRWDEASGEVTLRLSGSCRGCPQSAVTLKETILKALKHYVPVVKSVVAEDAEVNESDLSADMAHEHDGEHKAADIAQLAAAGTPFFSVFANMKVEGKVLKRLKFMSQIELGQRTPEHIIMSCKSCGVKRSIEDPLDLLSSDKGNVTGNAAVAICPACCVLLQR